MRRMLEIALVAYLIEILGEVVVYLLLNRLGVGPQEATPIMSSWFLSHLVPIG